MYTTEDHTERILLTKSGYTPSDKLNPFERHQVAEEILQLEKEFANEIYLMRDRIV